MPKISLPVPETYQSITRPVYQAVIKQVLANTDVREATVIGSIGDQEQLPLNGSGHIVGSDSAVFSHRQKVLVRYKEEPQEQTLLAQPAVNLDGRFLFNDPVLQVGIRPVYTMYDCTLSFVYRTEDKQQATMWRDDIVRQIRNNRAEQLYEASYQYPFTDVGLVVLMEIHRLRELTAPYGQTFAEYWKQYSSEMKFTYLSKLDGEQLLPVVEEKQVNILGWLDFTIPPEETKGEQGATWEISFDVKFQYQRPITYVMHFPISVHQRLVSNKFYDRSPNYTPEWLADQGWVDEMLNAPRHLNWIRASNYLGIPYPHYDDWIPTNPNTDYLNLFTGLLKIDATDLRKVVDLTALGPYVIREQYLTYLRDQKALVFGVNRCALQVEIHEGQDRILEELSMGDDLIVRCAKDLDLRKVYHVRINVLTHLDRLSSDDSTTLRKYPTVCIPVLNWLYPRMVLEGLTPRVVANRIVNKEDYGLAVSKIRAVAKKRVQSFQLKWWTFNELFIITRRSES